MPNYRNGRTTRERILSRLIIAPSGCLIWTGSRDRDGYGRVKTGGKLPVLVHREAYRLLAAPIPEGMELDHLCRVRLCASPAHLEPVTRAENNRRRDAARKADS